jgi:hypothetical protein
VSERGDMKKLINKIKLYKKFVKLYLKHHKDINDYYDFSLGGFNGWSVPKGLNWLERTKMWREAD